MWLKKSVVLIKLIKTTVLQLDLHAILLLTDKSIFKKACATTGCGGNICPGDTCILVGETVTVGVRCWHVIGHDDSNVTATFNIHVSSSTFPGECHAQIVRKLFLLKCIMKAYYIQSVAVMLNLY